MPPARYTQNCIAFIWDFDRTISSDYMQTPLFRRFGVDQDAFWSENREDIRRFLDAGHTVNEDTVYLNKILDYVKSGRFANLSNRMLRDLGAEIQLAPGMPDFMRITKELVLNEQRYHDNDISVEHYVASTGLRPMIEGSAVGPYVDGVWACELIPDSPGDDLPLSHIGYAIDNTSKTRAIFEINKGVNRTKGRSVNDLVPEDDRRVPIRNMIYIADGPSDVPMFSVVGKGGGCTYGVHNSVGRDNYDEVCRLNEQGRVNHFGEADYSERSPTSRWLTRAMCQIADRICAARETVPQSNKAPSHVV